MEVLSRVEKHKTQKNKRPESVYWIMSFIFYALTLYLFVRYVTIQSSMTFLETMEIGLFFCSILFFDLYLLAFTFLSTRMVVSEEKTARAKYLIIAAWVVSLLYHFVLWLISSTVLAMQYYRLGIAITLGAFVFTLGHFCYYFSAVKHYQVIEHKSRNLENRREAYELLRSILCMSHVISNVMNKDPEVGHMMRWNQFDMMLDKMMSEAQPYVQAVTFTKEDLEKLMGVKLWMENLLMIIEQHPTHKDILKEALR